MANQERTGPRGSSDEDRFGYAAPKSAEELKPITAKVKVTVKEPSKPSPASR